MIIKKLQYFFIIVLFFNLNLLTAQTVSTYLSGSGLNGPDGFALDNFGNLFVANWGGGTGNIIFKITSPTSVIVFDSTSNAPDGLVFDKYENLYVSNYATGIINKIKPDGEKTVFAAGLNNPSALAFDTLGNLYVSNYGGQTISKILPNGTISTFASGFNAPLGLVFDLEDNLYVSNYNSGIINKVTSSGVVSIFATVPNPSTSRIQYLAIGSSGNFYLPSYGHNKIYKISASGVVSVYAGTGTAGGTDGPIASAQFNGPNSIVFDKNGNLYISEYNTNRIRKISGVEPVVSLEDNRVGWNESFLLNQNFPNPFNPETNINFNLRKSGFAKLKVYDILGKELITLVNEFKNAGTYSINFNASYISGGLSSGVYIYELCIADFTKQMKMMLVK
ncbi:MAG: T9SS type A sorting domain-containing protein [bacterium]